MGDNVIIKHFTFNYAHIGDTILSSLFANHINSCSASVIVSTNASLVLVAIKVVRKSLLMTGKVFYFEGLSEILLISAYGD